jgi:hypothetical protein
MRFILPFFLALCLIAAPALAAKSVSSRPAPRVLDNTGSSSEVEGVLRPGCAPWEDGKSVGIELPNNMGAVVYTEITSLEPMPGTSFQAIPGELKEGRAVIFRCSEDNKSCLQQKGTVHLTKADDEIFLGRIETERDTAKFILKLMPKKASCLL